MEPPTNLRLPEGSSIPYLDKENLHCDLQISCSASSRKMMAHRAVLGATCALVKNCLLELEHLEEDPIIVLAERTQEEVGKALDVIYGLYFKQVET